MKRVNKTINNATNKYTKNLRALRENGFRIKKYRALATRTFIIILIMSLLIGCVGFWIGHELFRTIFAWVTKDDIQAMTRAESRIVSTEEMYDVTGQILSIYDSIPDEEKGDGTGEDYLAAFEEVYGDEYDNIKSVMYQIRKDDSMRGCFIAAFSKEKDGRMIYLIDDDPNLETFCPPGSWDTYEQSLIDDLVEGAAPNKVESLLGLTKPIHAAWSVRRGSTICTGAQELYETDNYHVMICMDQNIDRMIGANWTFTRLFALFMTAAAVVIALIMMHVFRRRVVEPINQMADAAATYSENKGEGRLTERYFSNLDIHTGDEIENLSLTMKEMESDIADYVSNLTEMTAERERIETELDLARQLQLGSLPDELHAFPDRTEFTLCTSIDAARGIGGDFYDYYMIDDDHLALTMADVSGKGMPAALFMMSSQIILRDFVLASDNVSPAETLAAANNRICDRNQMEMFVTVWLGILELSTGRLIAANAGHEYSVIRRHDGEFELYKDKHGFVLGGMPGMAYEEYEITLEPGDVIFQYTDGVTEATDPDNHLFGTDRMLEALNIDKEAAPDQLLNNVSSGIDRFVREAEQFDDITMLCLKYHGKA